MRKKAMLHDYRQILGVIGVIIILSLAAFSGVVEHENAGGQKDMTGMAVIETDKPVEQNIGEIQQEIAVENSFDSNIEMPSPSSSTSSTPQRIVLREQILQEKDPTNDYYYSRLYYVKQEGQDVKFSTDGRSWQSFEDATKNKNTYDYQFTKLAVDRIRKGELSYDSWYRDQISKQKTLHVGIKPNQMYGYDSVLTKKVFKATGNGLEHGMPIGVNVNGEDMTVSKDGSDYLVKDASGASYKVKGSTVLKLLSDKPEERDWMPVSEAEANKIRSAYQTASTPNQPPPKPDTIKFSNQPKFEDTANYVQYKKAYSYGYRDVWVKQGSNEESELQKEGAKIVEGQESVAGFSLNNEMQDPYSIMPNVRDEVYRGDSNKNLVTLGDLEQNQKSFYVDGLNGKVMLGKDENQKGVLMVDQGGGTYGHTGMNWKVDESTGKLLINMNDQRGWIDAETIASNNPISIDHSQYLTKNPKGMYVYQAPGCSPVEVYYDENEKVWKANDGTAPLGISAFTPLKDTAPAKAQDTDTAPALAIEGVDQLKYGYDGSVVNFKVKGQSDWAKKESELIKTGMGEWDGDLFTSKEGKKYAMIEGELYYLEYNDNGQVTKKDKVDMKDEYNQRVYEDYQASRVELLQQEKEYLKEAKKACGDSKACKELADDMIENVEKEIKLDAINQKIAKELAYESTWALTNLILQEFAFKIVDDMCKEDWDSSEPTHDKPVDIMGSTQFIKNLKPEVTYKDANNYEIAPATKPCKGLGVTAQLRITANVHRVTYSIVSCKNLEPFEVYLKSSNNTYTIESGFLAAGETKSDDTSVRLAKRYPNVCVKVEEHDYCFPAGK